MSTTASRGFQDTSRRAYVAAIPFNNDLYIYTAGPLPNGTMGALGPYPKATALNCPAGRILRETGNKIYPDANPGITTTMVAVYDEVTFFTGFIDPNCPTFGVYSTDLSYFAKPGVNPATGLTDVGPPVYTLGSVVAGTITTASVTPTLS